MLPHSVSTSLHPSAFHSPSSMAFETSLAICQNFQTLQRKCMPFQPPIRFKLCSIDNVVTTQMRGGYKLRSFVIETLAATGFFLGEVGRKDSGCRSLRKSILTIAKASSLSLEGHSLCDDGDQLKSSDEAISGENALDLQGVCAVCERLEKSQGSNNEAIRGHSCQDMVSPSNTRHLPNLSWREVVENMCRTSDSEGQRSSLQKSGQQGWLKRVKVGRRAMLLKAGATYGLGRSCQCCREAIASEWGYGGPSGPKEWGGMCATGPRQSPVDVPVSNLQEGEALGELLFEYKASSPSFQNTGHGTMQVNYPLGQYMLHVGGRELQLLQFHFHTPSEHAFDGFRYPMEAHLVHRDVTKNTLAVVGVMLDTSGDAFPNKCLAAALRYSPVEHSKVLTVPYVQLSAAYLLPPANKKTSISEAPLQLLAVTMEGERLPPIDELLEATAKVKPALAPKSTKPKLPDNFSKLLVRPRLRVVKQTQGELQISI